MGVESDRLVFDYLSRVGDLAQAALPAADRMRLVAQLRNDIEQARGGADSPAAVQRLLGRFGSPDEVVEAAAGSAPGGAPSGPAAPEPPAGEPAPGSYGPYAKRPGGARRSADGGRTVPPPREAAAKGRPERQPDGWSGGLGEPRLRQGDEVAGLPGMTGGIFIPIDDEELAGGGPSAGLPPLPGALAKDGAPPAEEEIAQDEAEAAQDGRRRGWGLPRLLRRSSGGSGGGGGVRGWGSPLLLLAAALLVAGTVLGSWIPLGLGWLCGYLSRSISRTQAKIAVFGVPAATVLGYAVWFWGRDAGRWGTPVAQGQLGDAIQDALPAAVRVAAIGSAVYLLWRARRSA